MDIITAYATKNDCYKTATPLTPKGIVVHSTGANNPNLSRYVDCVEECGVNKYGNHWNNSAEQMGRQVCVHAFIGYDKNKKVRVANILPYNYACWGVGRGSKGSFNFNPVGHIQFEMCEDDLTNREYCMEVYNVAVEYSAYLCKKFNLDPLGKDVIVSHKEAHALGYGCNHGDPDNWWSKHGLTMDMFRQAVKVKMGGSMGTIPDSKPVVTTTIKAGDLVKISSNAVYYTGGSIPSWVKNQNWYVSSVKGNRVVINQNENKTNAINSAVDSKYLTVITGSSSGSTTNKVDSTFKKRTTAPSATDKYWVHVSRGGLNECIKINNTTGSCLPNCFAGDTKFITRDGIKTMFECLDQKIQVKCKDGQWRDATVKYFGTAQLSRVEFTNGSVYWATDNHRWITLSESRKTEYVKTTEELKVGDFIPYVVKNIDVEPDEDGIRHGFIFGDGAYGYNHMSSIAYLCGDEIDYMKKYFEGHKRYVRHLKNIDVEVVLDYPEEYKSPVNIHETMNYLLGFLIGYIASDGCVSDDGDVGISSAKYDNLMLVKNICAVLGLRTKPITIESRYGYGTTKTNLYRIRICRTNFKSEWLLNPRHRKNFESKPIKQIYKTTVKRVTKTENYSDIFCVVEPETQTFVLDGYELTMNCCGYSWGRFYEITGKRPNLSRANAENWYGFTADGYKRSQTPVPGAVICWSKGKAGVESDGAGHVAIVEEVRDNGDIVTSNSDYGGTRFYMRTFRKANNYYIGKDYTFQGFILPPTSTTQTTGGLYKAKVTAVSLNIRKGPGTTYGISGIAKKGQIHSIISEASGKGATKWGEIENGGWISLDYVEKV